MTKQEAKEIYWKIRTEYLGIPFPKYQNADLKDLEMKHESLKGLKDLLLEDAMYIRLMNSISQTIAKLSKKGSWLNISERGINKSIVPVVKKGGSEIQFPFEWMSEKTKHVCSINGYWDARNDMVMDVLGYFFLLKEGGDQLPEEKFNVFDNFESIKAREMELNREGKEEGDEFLLEEALKSHRYCVKFDDRYFRKFTGKNKMHSNEILNLLLETSRVEFRIAFPVRMREEGKSGIKEKWYCMNLFSRFFEMGYRETERNDGIVQNRTYFIFFNTILGELFVHNLLTKGYDWVDNSLYDLPQSAQMFYRRFLLHHNYASIELSLDTIAANLNLQDKNRTNLMTTIEGNSLKPLQKNRLILSYEKKVGLSGGKYKIFLRDKSKLRSKEIVESSET